MDTPSLRVLLVGGNACDARAMCELLCVSRAIHFQFEWSETLPKGATRLKTGAVDVVLCYLVSPQSGTAGDDAPDNIDPDGDGLAAIHQLREFCPDIPIVVLSEVANEELAINAVKAGAQDYLVQGEFDLSLIERSLHYAVERQLAQKAFAVQRAELGNSQTKLREQTRILESILLSLSDGIVVANKEGKFLVFNPAGERMVGLGAADVGPEEWAQHYQLYLSDGETPFPLDELPLVRAMRGESFADEEVVVRRSDGSLVSLSVNGSPLTDPDGQLNGGTVVFRDMTEVKAADREIRRLNTELEKRVQERTKELANMNDELEAFCYSVSHDLRRPLRHLDGYSLTLLEDYGEQLDPKGIEFLKNVRSAAQQMGELIDALLRMSRTARGQVKRKRVNLSDTARLIADQLQRRDPLRQVHFSIADNVFVQGDPDLMSAVLENLMDNAWKFTSQSCIAQIEFDKLKRQGEEIYYLRDNGVGFNPKFASNLFKPFQRLHSVHEFDGYGIGLATVERIVSRHGGRVWADSQPQQGATFYFTLGNADAAPEQVD